MTRMFDTFFFAERKEFAARTDADGRFDLVDLPHGRFRLYARRPGYTTGMVSHIDVPVGGDPPGVEMVLPRGASIRGVARDAEGFEIEGLRVRAYHPRIPGAIDLHDMGEDFVLRNETRTAADGSFLLDSLSEGLWNVEFLGEGHARTVKRNVPTGSEIDVVVGRRGGLRGLVLSAQTQEPVPRFSVHTRRGIFGIHERHYEHPEGRFVLEGIEQGDYQLTVRAPGHADHLEVVTVGEGTLTEGLIIVLKPGVTVRGVVRRGTGEPVMGAEVVSSHRHRFDTRAALNDMSRFGFPEESFSHGALPGLPDQIDMLEGFARTGRIRTDPAGRFEISGLPRQVLTLQARHPRHRASAVQELDLRKQRDEVHDGVVLEMDPGGAIAGTVELADGTPLVGAVVMATRGFAEIARQAVVAESGEFLLSGLEPGSHAVVLLDLDLSRDDPNLVAQILSRMQPRFVIVEDGKTSTLEIEVPVLREIGCTVRGQVLARGVPRTSGMVTLAPRSGVTGLFSGGLRTGIVHGDGHYEVRGVGAEYRSAIGFYAGSSSRAKTSSITATAALLGPAGRVDLRTVRAVECRHRL